METRPFQAGFDGRGDFITPALPRTERAIQSDHESAPGRRECDLRPNGRGCPVPPRHSEREIVAAWPALNWILVMPTLLPRADMASCGRHSKTSNRGRHIRTHYSRWTWTGAPWVSEVPGRITR